jgi:hypothetical protein
MINGRHDVRSVPACVQALEPRCLLSATLPTLTGAPYDGSVGNNAADIEIVFSKETKAGTLVGTFTEDSFGSISVRSFTGSVNSHGKLVLHIKKKVVSVNPHFVINPETLTGAVSADGTTMAGTTKSGEAHGTFAATRNPT